MSAAADLCASFRHKPSKRGPGAYLSQVMVQYANQSQTTYLLLIISRMTIQKLSSLGWFRFTRIFFTNFMWGEMYLEGNRPYTALRVYTFAVFSSNKFYCPFLLKHVMQRDYILLSLAFYGAIRLLQRFRFFIIIFSVHSYANIELYLHCYQSYIS